MSSAWPLDGAQPPDDDDDERREEAKNSDWEYQKWLMVEVNKKPVYWAPDEEEVEPDEITNGQPREGDTWPWYFPTEEELFIINERRRVKRLERSRPWPKWTVPRPSDEDPEDSLTKRTLYDERKRKELEDLRQEMSQFKCKSDPSSSRPTAHLSRSTSSSTHSSKAFPISSILNPPIPTHQSSSSPPAATNPSSTPYAASIQKSTNSPAQGQMPLPGWKLKASASTRK